MDVLIGGLAVILGIAFIVLDAPLYRRLDLLAWIVVLTGGVMIVVFGLAIAAASRSRGGSRGRLGE